ncbi:phosphonate C-P lyase system protein PhnG [Neptuniibacter halophilus]|uniref:phosphonate C-P lyase system protein PhnG n=1 Tax=Neptuniibacter halophilus TaxID=651666 RepID=UPI002573321F|nr:phosphonate C-P lyase system protein PhnG [Neptuniibacter halophilus]
MSVANQQNQANRQQWMDTLAKADSETLVRLWRTLGPEPEYSFIRQPETGLTMVRGRIGGSGQPFNIGEMTLTRCAVRLSSGTLGVSYVAGRNQQHATIAALADALLQQADSSAQVQQQLITPLQQAYTANKTAREAQVSQTKVDFFTLVRGED